MILHCNDPYNGAIQLITCLEEVFNGKNEWPSVTLTFSLMMNINSFINFDETNRTLFHTITHEDQDSHSPVHCNNAMVNQNNHFHNGLSRVTL